MNIFMIDIIVISVNKAWNKVTYSSSETGQLVAPNAIDGLDSTCFQSLSEQMPWWMVDLQQSSYISGVYILTTSDILGTKYKRF